MCLPRHASVSDSIIISSLTNKVINTLTVWLIYESEQTYVKVCTIMDECVIVCKSIYKCENACKSMQVYVTECKSMLKYVN